jgi:hypothetical protein
LIWFRAGSGERPRGGWGLVLLTLPSGSWEWTTHKVREEGGVLAKTSRPCSPISSSR